MKKANTKSTSTTTLSCLIISLMITLSGCGGDGAPKDDVVMLGDSIFALTGSTKRFLTDFSGNSYRSYYVSGAQIEDGPFFLDSVIEQYDDAVDDDPEIATIIMNGGSNDLLFESIAACPIFILTRSCRNFIDDLIVSYTALLDDMRDDGVSDVIIVGYYNMPNAVDIWGYLNPAMEEMCNEANYGGMNCYFVSTTEAFLGRIWLTLPDLVHPSLLGSRTLAELIWEVMEENDVER